MLIDIWHRQHQIILGSNWQELCSWCRYLPHHAWPQHFASNLGPTEWKLGFQMGEVRSVWNSPSTIYSVHHWSESPRCGDYTYKCQALKLQHKNWSEGSYISTSYCIVTCTFFFWRVNIFVKLLLNKSNLPAKYCKLYKSQRRSHEKENKNKKE